MTVYCTHPKAFRLYTGVPTQVTCTQCGAYLGTYQITTSNSTRTYR